MQQETVELSATGPVVAGVDGGPGAGGAGVAAAGSGGGDGPAGDAAAADAVEGDAPPAVLIYVQGFTADRQRQVLSLWNSCDAGGLLAHALASLRESGWFDGGDQDLDGSKVVRQRHALAAALMVSVAAFESAALTQQVSLDGVETLLGLLLNRRPAPAAPGWDVAGHEL